MSDDVQNLKIIKDFLTEIKTQYRRGNRAPVYFTIMDYDTEFVHDRSGEPYLYQPDDGKMVSYYDYRRENEKTTLEEFLSLPDIVYGFMQARGFQRGMFLTESDAEEHLRKNYYHYSPKAHTFVDTIYRAPKLEAFLSALMEFFDISGKQKQKPLYGVYKTAEDYYKASKGGKNV